MQATFNQGGLQPHDDDTPAFDDRQVLRQNLLAKRREAIAGRAGSGIEEEWTEDEEHYQGIDDANRAFQTSNMLYRSKSKAVLSSPRTWGVPLCSPAAPGIKKAASVCVAAFFIGKNLVGDF